MKVRVHVWVSGHVQGVSFRFYTRDLANQFGVNGWIKNLPDGRLEAVFEGEETEVNRIVEFCRKGPGGAHVTDVNIQNEQFLSEFKKFDIAF